MIEFELGRRELEHITKHPEIFISSIENEHRDGNRVLQHLAHERIEEYFVLGFVDILDVGWHLIIFRFCLFLGKLFSTHHLVCLENEHLPPCMLCVVKNTLKTVEEVAALLGVVLAYLL